MGSASVSDAMLTLMTLEFSSSDLVPASVVANFFQPVQALRLPGLSMARFASLGPGGGFARDLGRLLGALVVRAGSGAVALAFILLTTLLARWPTAGALLLLPGIKMVWPCSWFSPGTSIGVASGACVCASGSCHSI